jgi:hypothetical protein
MLSVLLPSLTLSGSRDSNFVGFGNWLNSARCAAYPALVAPGQQRPKQQNAPGRIGLFREIWGNIWQQTGKASGNIMKHELLALVNNLMISRSNLNMFERGETPRNHKT